VIADPEFPRIAVAAGGVADVPAELARSLLEQPDRWEAVESKSKPKKVAPSGEKE
jgi:hypothetical protein